jgi:hypothetical protein
MIYRGPGFSLSYDLAPRSPSPPSLPMEWGGRGAESYDRKTVWSSTNHLILSAVYA